MRTSLPLCAQHIQRAFNRHWLVQGKRRIEETRHEAYLKKLNIPVVDAMKFIEPAPKEKIQLNIIGLGAIPLPRDSSHPEYKEKVCHIYGENNVLIEGFAQAQVLTKTIHMSEGLPESVHSNFKTLSDETHNVVKDIIYTANIFDCEQKKLPKIREKDRPAHILPVPIGITDVRKNVIMSHLLLDFLEKSSENLSENRYTTEMANCVTSFIKDDNLIQIQSPSDILLSSTEPLRPISEDYKATEGIDLPSIYPSTFTVSIPTHNFYEFDNIYPFDQSVKAKHPHTTYLSFSKTQTKNLFDVAVTDDQIKGRSLVHAFAVSSAYAKSIYGNVEILPKPVTLQCIHSDGRKYHFGIFQLNTLNVNGTEGVKNMWYSMPIIKMFKHCSYVGARHELTDYNAEVFEYLKAFYLHK